MKEFTIEIVGRYDEAQADMLSSLQDVGRRTVCALGGLGVEIQRATLGLSDATGGGHHLGGKEAHSLFPEPGAEPAGAPEAVARAAPLPPAEPSEESPAPA